MSLTANEVRKDKAMGYAVALDQVMEVTWLAKDTRNNAQIVNRMHYICTIEGSPPTNDLTIVADKMKIAWSTNQTPILSSNYRLLSTTVREITGAIQIGGPPTHHKAKSVYGFNGINVINDFGGVGGAALPSTITASVQFKASITGRTWKGGVHMGPIPTVQQSANENEMTGVGAANWSAAFAAMQDVALNNGGQVTHVLWSPSYYAWNLLSTGPLKAATKFVTTYFTPIYLKHQISRQAPHVP